MNRWMITRVGTVQEIEPVKILKHSVVLSNGRTILKTSKLYKLPFEAVNELNKRKSKNARIKQFCKRTICQ